MIFTQIIEPLLAIGVLFTFIRFVLPTLESDAREHRRQLRRLKRNILQTRVAEKQLELEQRLHPPEDTNCERGHAWRPWSTPKVIKTTNGGLDADQHRFCARCNTVQTRSVNNGGWSLR